MDIELLDKTVFIVCGSASCGNRLLISILCRSGCNGQPIRYKLDPDAVPSGGAAPFAFLTHTKISYWIAVFKQKGYEQFVCLVPVREPYAMACSVKTRDTSNTAALASIMRNASRNITLNASDFLRLELEHYYLSYEGLTESALKKWLPYLGLRYSPGAVGAQDIAMTGEIENQNGKHYAT